MTSEHEFDGSYVIRSGWTRFAVLWSLVVSGLVAVCFLPGAAPAQHIELALVPVPLFYLAVCSGRRRRVTFDGRGITFHRFLSSRPAEVVPWSDVLAVDWRDEHPRSTLLIHRRATDGDTPFPLPADHPATEMLDQLLARLDDPEFAETYRTSVRVRRDTTLCRVDPFLLASAVALLAPGVRHHGDLGALDLGDLALVLGADDPGADDPGADDPGADDGDSGGNDDQPDGTAPRLSGS
ncbi:hypothetical protein ACFVUN_13720 [Kitasatospora griseola]|uniref:hypothetical protein n=1 Tax=Kitasatospora griseola TaxID=2064 RepID=UPI0036DF2CFC